MAGSAEPLHATFDVIGYFRSVPKMWHNCEAELSVITTSAASTGKSTLHEQQAATTLRLAKFASSGHWILYWKHHLVHPTMSHISSPPVGAEDAGGGKPTQTVWIFA